MTKSNSFVSSLVFIGMTALVFADAITCAEFPRRHEAQHLDNLVQVHTKVFSGPSPQTSEAFAELKSIGIKTLISVDGAQPQVAMAKGFGLRYVHLPHGYEGIPQDRVLQLAKAVHDLDGPFYVHCHHGRYRSPAAASVACIATGLISQKEGLATLEIAGTSPRFQGLYHSVASAKRLEESELDQLRVNFQESVEVPPMAKAMVAIEQTHDQLLAIANANWQSLSNQIDPNGVQNLAHEALLLREHFAELMRTEEAKQRPNAFQHLLHDSNKAAEALEIALRNWQLSVAKQRPESLDKSLNRLSQNCLKCHQNFRD